MSATEVFTPVDRYDRRLVLDDRGLLGRFNRAGLLTAADVHVAGTLARAAGEQDDVAVLGAAFAVRGVRLGSVAVDLHRLTADAAALNLVGDPGSHPPVGSQQADNPPPYHLPWPDPQKWTQRIARSALAAQRALVVDHELVYLQRYHALEVRIVADLTARAAQNAPIVDKELLGAGLARHLSPDDADQRAAVLAALGSWTTVLTGGPGTGKTTTAALIVALLAEQAWSAGADRPLRVALAAPTGRAAARLQEALGTALAGAPGRPGLLSATPPPARAGLLSATPPPARAALESLLGARALTVHRLLGAGRGRRLRHHRGNRLPHDVVVIDEASMVSLPLLAQLLQAVRPQTRLLLIGDPDQLASVDAGAVLADLVAGAATGPRSPVQVVQLTRVHRYGHDIAALADAVRTGDGDTVMRRLRAHQDSGDEPPIAWLPLTDPADPSRLTDLTDSGIVWQRLRPSLTRQALQIAEHARHGRSQAALVALAAHRLLCVHRQGPFGVSTWNARITRWLQEQSPTWLPEDTYVGRPLLVTANDAATGLVNGDTGVIIQPSDPGGVPSQPLAVFAAPTGPHQASATHERVLAPSRLGAVDTCYATTIHKAQGSQADAVTILLPERDSPFLTRELLYTGLTRARSRVLLVGSEAVIRAAVARRVTRASGLRQRLTRSG